LNLNKFTVQKSFAINAGAGCGKTYTLRRRYINALVGFDYFREDYSIQESNFENLKPVIGLKNKAQQTLLLFLPSP